MTLPLLALIAAQSTFVDLQTEPKLQAPVSMKMRAKRIPLALAEISKAGGVKLSSGPEFENEPLVVLVNNVSLASLMEQTAKAAGGRWVKTNLDYRLMRPSALTDKFKLQERQWIQESLRLASAHPLPETLEAKIQAGVFRLVTPEFVNTLSPLDRVVFSDTPSAWQVPAGAVGRDMLQLAGQKWRADKIASEAPKKEPTTEDEEEENDEPIEISQFPPDALRVVTYWVNPYNLFVGFPSPAFLYEFEERPPKARYQFPEYVRFRTAYIPLLAGGAKEFKLVLNDKDRPFVVKPPHDGFYNLSNVLYGEQHLGKPAIPEFEKMVMHPDVYDPLSFAISDYFFTLAEDQKLDIVAIPTDDFFELIEIGGIVVADFSFTSLTEQLNESEPMRVTKDGTYLRVEPTWKLRSNWARLNRIAFRKFLDRKQESTTVPLAPYAEFASSVPDFALNIFTLYGDATGFQSPNSTYDYHVLRFYHSLSPIQREALLNGQKLVFSQFTPQLKMVTERMISQSSGFVGEDFRGDQPGVPAEIPQEVSAYLEITDIITPGFERTLELSARKEANTVVALAEYNGYPAKQPPFSAAMLAFARDQIENTRQPIENGIIPNFDKYRLGQEISYELEVLLTPKFKRTVSLTDTQISQKVYRYDELPADFRATAETVRDRVRARRARP